jgi:hypothetical protein
MKLDKEFTDAVKDNCYEDKNTTRGIVVLVCALAVLVLIGLIYGFATLSGSYNFINNNRTYLNYTAYGCILFAIFGFGLFLICPHKVYKELKLKEDKKNEKDKTL